MKISVWTAQIDKLNEPGKFWSLPGISSLANTTVRSGQPQTAQKTDCRMPVRFSGPPYGSAGIQFNFARSMATSR